MGTQVDPRSPEAITHLTEEASPTTGDFLLAYNETGFGLEDIWQLEKIAGHTRIPAGRYPVGVRTHGKFYETYRDRIGRFLALWLLAIMAMVFPLGPAWGQTACVNSFEEAAEPMAELRRQRDRLLAETDWWGVTDRTMSAEETAYRQALRDMPVNNPLPTLSGENNDIIGNITWLTKP